MLKTDLSLAGAALFTPRIFFDERGFFYESFTQPFFQDLGYSFVQDNHSFSKKGVLRGMHFQRGQAKLVNVISGVIFDVIVDMRKGSKTFGMWEGVVLDASQRKMLLVPDGFAHGFYVVSDEAHVVYKVSSLYDPKLEKSFRYDDSDVAIAWPEGERIISARDKNASFFREVLA